MVGVLARATMGQRHLQGHSGTLAQATQLSPLIGKATEQKRFYGNGTEAPSRSLGASSLYLVHGHTIRSATTWKLSNATLTGSPANVAAWEMLKTASVRGTSSVGPVPLMIGIQLRPSR
jgi:hypothetical protein